MHFLLQIYRRKSDDNVVKIFMRSIRTSINHIDRVDIKKRRSKKVDFWGFWDPEKRAIFGRFSDFLGFFPNVILTKNDDFGGTMIPPSWFLDLGHFWPFLTCFWCVEK